MSSSSMLDRMKSHTSHAESASMAAALALAVAAKTVVFRAPNNGRF
jgi:hypothetical protein